MVFYILLKKREQVYLMTCTVQYMCIHVCKWFTAQVHASSQIKLICALVSLSSVLLLRSVLTICVRAYTYSCPHACVCLSVCVYLHVQVSRCMCACAALVHGISQPVVNMNLIRLFFFFFFSSLPCSLCVKCIFRLVSMSVVVTVQFNGEEKKTSGL